MSADIYRQRNCQGMASLWANQRSMFPALEISYNGFLISFHKVTVWQKRIQCFNNTHNTDCRALKQEIYLFIHKKILNECIHKVESVHMPCYEWNHSCQIIQRHFVRFKKSETFAQRSMKHIKIWSIRSQWTSMN